MGESTQGTWASCRRELGAIALLLAVGFAVKGLLLARTEVVARDGIGFIQIASRLDREPWTDVVRQIQQHPLYSVHILGIARIVRPFAAGPEYQVWQLSAQLASMLCGVLLAIPMYLLGRELFDRRVGFWAALLFQVMPVPARIAADALSDSVALFWAAHALLFAVYGLRRARAGWFALAGLCGGLAYLTRPEGALVLCAAFLILVGLAVLRGRWRGSLLQAAALGLTALLVVGPYWLTIGRLSVKPTVEDVLKTAAAGERSTLLAARFMPGTNEEARHTVNALYAASKIMEELAKGFHYLLGLPALAAVLVFHRRRRGDAAWWLLLVILAAQLAILARLGTVFHYVSERHVLIVLYLGYILGVAALWEWGPAAVAWLGRRGPAAVRAWVPALPLALALGYIGWGLSRTWQPLHASHAAHKAAGVWLAGRMSPTDEIVDPFGWASFYSGRTTAPRARRTKSPDVARYLVTVPGEWDRSRRQMLEKAAAGTMEEVFAWPAPERARLIVLRTQPYGRAREP